MKAGAAKAADVLTAGGTVAGFAADIAIATGGVGAIGGAAANMLTFGVGGGNIKPRGGKMLSYMAKDFSGSIMKGLTKTVAGKTISRAKPIVRTMMANNFLSETAMTGVIGFGAWLNSMAWGTLLP